MNKITAVLLLAVLLVTSFTACSSGGGDSVETTTAADAVETTTAQETREPLDIPDGTDYDGYEFKIFTYTVGDSVESGYTMMTNYNEIVAEAETGEIINDAVYQRNRAVEERIGIKIVPVIAKSNELTSKLKANVQAGSTEYDTALQMIRAAQNTAAEKFLVNLYDIDTLNLDKPWWNSRIQEGVAINNNLFVITGDATIQDKETLGVVFYNHTRAEALGLGDIYETVESGKWTFDEMWKQCSDATADVDGDGVIGANDYVGTGSNYTTLPYFLSAVGAHLAELDSDGKPITTLDSERTVSFIQKMANLFNDSGAMVLAGKIDGGWTTIRTMFKTNRMLIQIGNTYAANSYRDMDGDFSLLYLPKLDEAQSEYYVPTGPHASVGFVVPVTNSDYERTGIILESIAYYSTDTVRSAYVDITLSGKVMRNEKSVVMLNNMLESMLYDIGYVFDWAGIVSVVNGSVQTNDSTIVSAFASVKDAYLKAMDATYQLYK